MIEKPKRAKKIDAQDRQPPRTIDEVMRRFDLDNNKVYDYLDGLVDVLNEEGTYTQATGTYTTAVWSTGTNTCVWTAPKTGLYIVWMHYNLQDDTNVNIYHQLHMRGTASKANGNLMLYETNNSSTSAFEGSKLVYAKQGQTIIPYVHCPTAGIVWNVYITGLFIR